MPGSPSLPPRPTLARFSIAVETSAQAQAIQAFLWCLWWIQWARIANLTSTLAAGAVRNEFENFGYDALDRLITHTPILGITDQGTGSNAYDLAGNVTSKAGLALGYASNSNALCNTTASAACTRKTAANAVAGDVVYDGNGNIQSYTRPLTASTPGADGALLNLFEYSSFNMPRLITKSLNGAVVTSGEFFYDAGYQRVRQIKRTGATTFGTGNIADDVLYVVPGGFEVHRNSAGQVTSSIATISGSDGVAATVSTVFDVNTGLPVAQNNIATGNVSTAQSGTDTVTKLILKDHLGSMVAEITLAGTAASPSVNIATLVIHGFGPWGNARGANPFAEGQRGFTGHEHLAELGIIHMNGRLYDPVLGRFLQADPIIQAPHNAQSHNRYVYVLNNPLSFTDPSGFSAWTQWRAPILALAAAITMQYYLMPYLLGASTFAALSTGGKFVAVVASGFASGGIAGGNIQSALQGAFSAALFFGVGTAFEAGNIGSTTFGSAAGAAKVAAHAAVGCASATMAGGSCGQGALSAGFAEAAGNSGLMPKGFVGGLVGRMIVGGIASRLGGGKFENGALTAAFGYLYNFVAHKRVVPFVNMATGQPEPQTFYDVDFSGTPRISAAQDELGEYAGPKGRLKWLYRLGGMAEGTGYGTPDIDGGYSEKVRAYKLDAEMKEIYKKMGFTDAQQLTPEQFRSFIATVRHTIVPDFKETYGTIDGFIKKVDEAYDRSIGKKVIDGISR